MHTEKNHQIILVKRPGVDGEPENEHFACVECPSPSGPLPEDHVLIKTCYLSVDPALRCMMNEDPGVDYLPPWLAGQLIHGFSGVGVILDSNHTDYTAGDIIMAVSRWPWVRYFTTLIQGGSGLDQPYQKLDKVIFGPKPSLGLSILVGLTALIGLWEKGHVTSGTNQTLVVSGGAGATGSLAGQMGRLLGCTNVIGICGSDVKCEWLTKQLGYTGAINYKTCSVPDKLTRLCPNGVDIYFDNVGGDISDAVIRQWASSALEEHGYSLLSKRRHISTPSLLMRGVDITTMMCDNSHVILCGQISQYNRDVPYPPPLSDQIVSILTDNNITRERFLVLQYKDRYDEALKQLMKWILSGQIQCRETITEGFENTGAAFVSMMRGGNIGKQIIHVEDCEL